MKSLIIASALLVLAAPAFAFTPTPTQNKDINRLYSATSRCHEYIPGDGEGGSDPHSVVVKAENQVSKRACDRSNKLAQKLVQQGFCFHKYYNVGWPNKKTGQCDEVRIH
jgi:hypothetical protein